MNKFHFKRNRNSLDNLFYFLKKENFEKVKSHFLRKDEQIFKSRKLQKEGYVVSDLKRREIITPYGKIELSRIRYYAKKVAEGSEEITRIPLLEAMGMEKYARITPQVYELILNSYFLSKSKKTYSMVREEVKRFSNVNLSDKTIANYIKKYEKEIFFAPQGSVEVKDNIIFVNFDDFHKTVREWRSRQCHKNTRFRNVSACNSKGDKRWTFSDFLGNKVHPEEITIFHVSLFVKWLRSQFKFDFRKTTLIFCCDGASNLKQIRYFLNKLFYKVHFILDSFHFSYNVNEAFGKRQRKNREIKAILKSLFDQGDFEGIINFLKQQYQSNAVKALIKYCENNKEGIINHKNNEWKINCNQESGVSLIKRLVFGYGGTFGIEMIRIIKKVKLELLNRRKWKKQPSIQKAFTKRREKLLHVKQTQPQLSV